MLKQNFVIDRLAHLAAEGGVLVPLKINWLVFLSQFTRRAVLGTLFFSGHSQGREKYIIAYEIKPILLTNSKTR